jgi:thiamine-monophosphate kinase
MSELALVERIAARTVIRRGTSLGIGDDAAILDLGGPAVVTHDMLVEGVHFRLDTTGVEDLGAKAVAVNLSDLAAMGVEAIALIVGLGLPRGFSANGRADALSAAIETAAAAYDVTVAGGDVTLSPVLVLGITAIGRPAPGVAPLRRSGGRLGDLLCVTGALGGSAAGRALLEDSCLLPDLAQRADLTRAHLRPIPRLAAGLTLAGRGATAMLDLSDGLALDVHRLARASGFRARIDLGELPLAPGAADVFGALGRPAALAAASGGEDYELLAAIPPECLDLLRGQLDVPLTTVGALVEGTPGVELRDRAGALVTTGDRGWEHDV